MSDEAKLLGDLVRSGVVSDAIAAHVSLLMDAGFPLVVVSEESRLGARVADAFADAIVRLLTDADATKRLSEAGRQLALDRYDRQVIARQVLETISLPQSAAASSF